ncbi:MAG: TonB family protein [Candidatus Acidiferrales bacterium]|jgi:TonB family protein
MASTSRVLFSPLPDGESRYRSFSAGLGLEFVALVLLVVIPMLMPQRLEVVTRYWITPIATPPVVPWKPQPRPAPQPVAVKQPVLAKIVQPVVVDPPKPRIITPVFTSPIAKPATAKRNTPSPDVPVVTPVYADKTPVSSLGSSAIPTLKKPREQVQTGGFGDPNGVPANPNSHGSPNIATVGSYDLPMGPGNGNGTGGAKGARGVVASSGFGNGVATGGPGGGRSGGGSIQQGGFSDQSPVAAAPKMKQAANSNPRNEPVEILSKPRPQYTDQARQKKIEGDVLLQVVFSATGQVEVQKVIRGLGYGLDEAAEAAARQIQFKPARQDGQPVDFAGNVHITFELAY